MKKVLSPVLFIVAAILLFSQMLFLFSCKNSDPLPPPADTATFTATVTGTVSHTATITSTPTITPTSTTIISAGCTFAYGYPQPNDDHGWGPAVIVAASFTAGPVTSLGRMAVKIGSVNRFAAGIYTDSAGVPALKIAETGGQDSINGWNEANLTSACSLVNGTTYWIVAVAQNASSVRDNSVSTATEKVANWTYSDTLPADMSGFSWYTYTGYEMKAYALTCP